MAELIIPYEPNDKQDLFHASPAEEVFYGGAKGGGKSCALVMDALIYATENLGAQIYLFRETYDDLEANLIQEWKEKVSKKLYTYNESKHIAKVYGGSTVKFRYIRNVEDALKYQGRSMDYIGVDELTKHLFRAIQILLSCLRSPKGFKPLFRGTGNPGGVGHLWVKERYIEPTDYGKQIIVDEVTGNRISFIPAKVYDNTVLMKNDPVYARRLENLPEDEKKAYLYGDWDVFAGQYFKEWKRDIHVIKPFELPNWWKRFRSLDYGLDCTACYWWAVDDQGREYIYRELYQSGLNLSQAAKKIIDMTPEKEKISYTVASPDLWNRRQETGVSGQEIMYGAGLKDLIKADNSRIPGWRTLREHLTPFKDEQDITIANTRIFDICTNLIRTLPALVHDEHNPEDVSDKCEDHAPESIRYGVMSRPGYTLVSTKFDIHKLPQDLIDDYYGAPPEERPRLLKKWGLV